MLRQLTSTEVQICCRLFPVLCAPADLPEDGVLVGVESVGCVFVFQKVDRAKTRIFIEVSEIWPNCVRQVLPAPEGFFDEVMRNLREVGDKIQSALIAAAVIVAGILILQSGILKKLA